MAPTARQNSSQVVARDKKQKKLATPKRKKPEKVDPDEEEEETQDGDVIRKNVDAMSAAVLGALEYSAKGQIKEADLRPLLMHYKFRDFQDNLRAVNNFLVNALGKVLVQDPINHYFYLRNNLYEETVPLRDLLTTGIINYERIDDGIISRGPVTDADAAEKANRNKNMTCVFAVLTSIMMSNNIDLPHSEWELIEDRISLLMTNLGFDEKTAEHMLKSFVKEGWIRISEEQGNNQVVAVHYHWGPRAIATIRTAVLFEKYCIATNQAKHEWGNYDEKLKKLDARTFS